MTNNQRTDDEIMEASRQYGEMTRNPSLMSIAARMESREPWKSMLDQDGLPTRQFSESQKNIHGMVSNAPDVSAWAINMGILGLALHLPVAVHTLGEKHQVGFQIATPKEWSDDMNQHLTFEVIRAVENTIKHILENPHTKG